MQRAPDRDEIEGAEIAPDVLGATEMHGKRQSLLDRRVPRLGDHCRLGVDADNARDIRRKADGEQPWAGPEVNQRLAPGKRQTFGRRGEK